MPGIDDCLAQAMGIGGAHGVSLLDWGSGLELGAAGRSPADDHAVTAAEAGDLVRLAAESLSFGEPEEPRLPLCDLILTTRASYHLFCLIGTVFDSRLLLHLWLDRSEANLAVARIRLQALAEELVIG
ncbi:hypothetical protein C7C46_30380 [Streptomyces tateyamensis]|uniref:Roadblock/LAMTOR2 domain-containing protein n=1 Tax=Streptomyces tateyamensis TaxID=565073 RepID=A0A2V4MTH7_9ACTN|nr:hypothetical protein [Streptomyces tateyamensis]PYC67376.1 hypothetical protein C7C46_30380 [Streptomyces tateyamensis]